jgi:formylglycine-generating enzyme required for sulfatase activity
LSRLMLRLSLSVDNMNNPSPPDDIEERIRRVKAAASGGVMEKLRIAELDPAIHFRFANWSGIDFSGCNLRGFDFTGARLHGCNFKGALIGAGPDATGKLVPASRFDLAELGAISHDREPGSHEPATMTPIANLRDAADWTDYSRQWRGVGSRPEREHLSTGSIFQDAPFAPELVVIPAGSFIMGSPETESERKSDEAQVLVTIVRPFAVGRFTVTFDQWEAYVADTMATHLPRNPWGERGNHPVSDVSWHHSQGYVAWLSKRTGQHYRLLSEAEWEYAARAGAETPFWWGSSITPAHANYDDRLKLYQAQPSYYDGFKPYQGGGTTSESREQTMSVDQFEANPWGLFNVHGNVWEWCSDNRHDTHKGNPGNGEARSGGNDIYRVVRGGSWMSSPRDLRAAYRRFDTSGNRSGVLGFRVARTL